MAIKVGDLYAELDANMSGWITGMERAGNSVVRLEREVRGTFQRIGRAVSSFNFLIGGAAVAGVANLVSSWAQGADEAGKFADRIGESTENLSRLQYVAELSGVSINTINESLQRQQRRLQDVAQGGTAYADALDDLRISISDIQDLSPAESFLMIAEAMQGIDSQARRVAIANDIWGRSGVALLQIVNQGTEAIEAMIRESDELGNTLSTEAAQDAARFNDSVTRLSRTLEGLANTVLPLVIDPLERILSLIASLIQWFRRLGETIDRYVLAPIRNLNQGVLNTFLDGLQVIAPTSASAIRALIGLARASDEVDRSVTNTNQSVDELTRKVKDTVPATEPLVIKITEVGDTYKKAGDDAEETVEKVEREMRTWEILTQRSLERLDDAFQSFWVSVLEGNKNIFDIFKRLAIETLAEIIHAYTTRKIVATIESVILPPTNAPGGQGGQTGGSAGTGGGIVDRILGGLSGIVGSIVGGLIGFGAGSLLGGLFGGGNRIKESQLFAGSPGMPVTGPANINTPSPFGNFISFGLHRFGGEGQLTNQQAEEILETLEAASRVMVGIDEIIADTLNEAQMIDVQESLRSLPDGSRNFTPEVIDQFIRDRYGAIFEAIDSALGGVFVEFSGGLEGDAILEFAQDIAALNAAMAEGNRVFSDVASVADTVTALLTDFAQEGETLSGVLERLAAANAALSQLGLEGATQSGALLNLQILEQFGNDAGRLQQLVSGFFETFFTDVENLERNISRLGGIVPDILGNLGTNREDFAQNFMSQLNQGLLGPEEVAAWLEAAEALGALIDLEEQLAAIRSGEAQAALDAQVASINETVAAINTQIDAQRDLQAQIAGISEAIEQSFGNTIEDIQRSMLGQEDEYNFLKDIIDQLSASISTITDPAEIERTMEEINRRVSEAFGILSPEQQAQVGPDFVTFLQEQLAAGQERLTELNEEAMVREAQLVQERERRQQEIAELMNESAITNSQSAQLFSQATNIFSAAAQQPVRVQVTVNPDTVGA